MAHKTKKTKSQEQLAVDSKMAWILTELKPHLSCQVGDRLRSVKEMHKIFNHQVVENVSYAVYRTLVGGGFVTGFIRIPPGMQKMQSKEEGKATRYVVLQGEVKFWVGEKNFVVSSHRGVTIPEGAFSGISNDSEAVALISFTYVNRRF